MIATVKAWLLAGSPAHYLQLLAVVAYAAIEWVLPRQKALAANSTVELIANALKPILGKVPLVGKLLAILGTPQVQALTQPDVARANRISVLLPFLLIGSLFASGCAGAAVFGSCLKGQAASDAQAIVTDVIAIVSSSAGYIDGLVQLAEQVGPGIVQCITAAIAADQKTTAKYPMLASHLSEYIVHEKARKAWTLSTAREFSCAGQAL
jgi:hypothetical protein